MLESLFNRVVGIHAWNIIEKRLRHKRFPVNIAKCLRTPFYRTSLVATSGFGNINF